MQETVTQKRISRCGFTLTEVLVVIAIIGIMASMSVAGMMGLINRHRIQGQTDELRSFLMRVDAEARKTGTPWSIVVDSATLSAQNNANCTGTNAFSMQLNDRAEIVPRAAATALPVSTGVTLNVAWQTNPLPGCIQLLPQQAQSSYVNLGYLMIQLTSDNQFQGVAYKVAQLNQIQSIVSTNGGGTWRGK